ncbi:Rha family transcriptional regulator [Ligilactobacillus animalis]|uniref:Rha family transcriptional regulator n=1 Tax=Ligilactobacillus animalis TaxID=1605 RepID=UPI00241E377B|nr:Rha family transcriptional regulator [Ligilactobacillus animalis]MDU8986939.1 Rha family transcriptional regulator [Ligilactobacillus animalis]WKB74427.1 Rha family transcriptional regulator [Ligilactobacillus animalis]
MEELVFLQSLKDEPYTTPEVIAEHTGIEYRSISDLIRRNKSELEYFGILRFEIVKINGRGRPKKVYHLNEQQATTLITFLDNTPQVKSFKVALVAQFFKMRDELTKRKINRIEEKPLRKTLTDAIKEWEHRTDWSYNHISNLLYKAVTGMNAKQLKKARNPQSKASLDVLTSEEQEQYKQLETRVIGYLLAQMTFGQIKAMLNGGTLQVTEWREVK